MATARHFNRRGKQGKFMIDDILYFKSPSTDGSRTYHYKQKVKKNGQQTKTIQITIQKYESAKKRIKK